MSEQVNESEIGALWEREGKKGPYLTGYVLVDGAKLPIVAFRVQRGGERAPTWRLLKSKPREDQPAREPAPVNADDMPW